jgi:hypothetical protein
MPADPLNPGEVGPEPRPEGQFRADLVRYLDALPTSELGSLLSELPRTRPGVLMVELNERLPDAGKLLPPAGTPGPGEGRRRSLREWAADRRAARNQPAAEPPDVVDRRRWRAGVTPPRAVDPATRGRLQDAVRALGEEAEADRAELERRAVAYDDPGCPPDLFGPDEPGTSERHHDHAGRYDEPSLNDKLAADDVGGMTDRSAHAEEWRPADWIEPTYPDRDRRERDERDER